MELHENRGKKQLYHRFWRSIPERMSKGVEHFFYRLGMHITQNPYKWILGCCIIMLLCLSGLFRFRQEKNPMKLWSPPDSGFALDTEWLMSHFEEGLRIQTFILTGNNVLEQQALIRLNEITKQMISIQAPIEKISWTDVCKNILDIWNFDSAKIEKDSTEEIIAKINTVKVSPTLGHSMNFSELLGGVTLDEKGRIIAATAIKTELMVHIKFRDVDMDKSGNNAGTADWVSQDGGKYQRNFVFNETFTCGKNAPRIIATTIEFKFTRFVSPSEWIPAMDDSKQLVSKAQIEGYATVWSKAFGPWTSDKMVTQEVTRNLILALICVMITTTILIAEVQTCCWILLCILLTLLNVCGFMYFWGQPIDMVSSIVHYENIVVINISIKVFRCSGTKGILMRTDLPTLIILYCIKLKANIFGCRLGGFVPTAISVRFPCAGLQLAIGLSVDYAAHVAHTFLHTESPKDDDDAPRTTRALIAVRHIGAAVAYGAGSTLLAVSMLAFSTSYVFIAFFRIFFLVILFGLWHGLIMLPVVLSIIGPPSLHATQRQPMSVAVVDDED
ncbi:patched domain-containing protein 3-like protein [Lasius niger]|uniref:Patched domain-containing protein 3-like protein n=1 Tax=Lasius niger TaxID=67767 RepID=A0A0J7KYB4_LASNI|nr:patched domain-containing protein 3-like protein [Lasius niger]